MTAAGDAERAHWATLARHRLGHQPTPGARRTLALALRAVADDLDRLATAEERQVARGNLTRPRAAGGAPGDFIRLGEEVVSGRNRQKSRLRLYIGRRLWYALGRPPRLDAQRVGAELRLVAVREGEAGVALSVGSGIPRAFVNQETWEILRLNEGRYAATVSGDTIIIGEPLA